MKKMKLVKNLINEAVSYTNFLVIRYIVALYSQRLDSAIFLCCRQR
jgi:hypothetical protein